MSDVDLALEVEETLALLDAKRSDTPRGQEPLLCVVGPTASGKTALSIAVAERIGGEVISADSVQIYRRFDKASGKPSEEERARVPHHLVDVADPLEPYDAARFVHAADAAIHEVRARGRVPVVCGGTFLWVKALVSGLSEAPAADETIRARHRDLVAERGREAFHAMLAAIDPPMAERLHPNDVVRVGRAIEVFEISGKRLSDLQAAHGFREARYAALYVTPSRSKDHLTERIRGRVHGFVASGLCDEVRALLDDGLRGARAMGSVGYKEAVRCVDGALALADLEPTIVRATRVFARRQRTWLGHEPVVTVGPVVSATSAHDVD